MSKGGTAGSNLNSRGKHNKYHYLIVHKTFYSLIVLWNTKRSVCKKVKTGQNMVQKLVTYGWKEPRSLGLFALLKHSLSLSSLMTHPGLHPVLIKVKHST